MTSVKDTLILTDREPNKGPNLRLHSDDHAIVARFRELCRSDLPSELNWFHRADQAHFQMFEFWRPESSTMTLAGRAIATELGLPFLLDLTKTYALRALWQRAGSSQRGK